MAGSQQLGLMFAAPQRKVYAVRELVAALRTHVERAFTDIYVEGEISNYRPADSGHLYFTLKDGSAQLRVVMWRGQARLLRFRPENGLAVIARGRVTIYDERGDLQLQAEMLEPKGAGALQLAFEQLKAKLAAEGLFDAGRKRPIPALPRRIGVVTSARGAALQDILNILRRRHESVSVLIYDARVQGESAASEVSAGVKHFNRTRNVDVIVVARGGGSFEDLFAFNDEALARTIAASKIPVISAVGHETDFSICDFVADLRAPTPSAAAELVIQSKQELAAKLTTLRDRLQQAVRYKLLRAHNALAKLTQHAALVRMPDAIARRQQRADDLVFRMAQAQRRKLAELRRRHELLDSRLRHQDLRVRLAAIRRQLEQRTAELRAQTQRLLAAKRTRTDQLTQAVGRAVETALLRRRAHWERLHSSLVALSPKAILARGYALVFDAAGNLVKDSSQLQPGGAVRAQLGRGEFTATVDEVTPESGAE
ncbi:MAG TPA: exodeoxyribonuclease VII large subunit [Candidatus Eisenbacteria bacterium]|nr:exodeoxyribonuclease VII large subunit [Candidatus Eisenbacteria bacterium]